MTTWIKCSERLPQENGEYLNYIIYPHKHIIVGKLVDGMWDASDDIRKWGYVVGYWAELLTPPEGE